MHAKKIAFSSLALVFGLALAGFAAASSDTSTPVDTPQVEGKACCKHHDATGDKTGMHCDHAKMKAQGEEGKACCAQHAAMHKEGADGMADCAKHAEMHKDGADGKTSCARHAAMMKDGDKKAGCCCEDACEHAKAPEAPAKS